MASVLPPPLAAPVEHGFGDSVFMRSASSCGDDACTVRRHVLRSQSPASFATASSLPSGVLSARKENSPLSGSTSSLINFNLFESFAAATPPRRSWSWALPGEKNVRNNPDTPSPKPCLAADDGSLSDSSSSHEITVLHVSNPDPNPKTPEKPSLFLYDDALRSGSLPDIAEESGSDTIPPTPQPSPRTNFGDCDGDSGYIPGQISPFKRWLRVLRKRSVPKAEFVTESDKRFVLDDFDTESARSPQRHALSRHRHRKTPSSVSSVALITAVKSASVTLASLSIYPRSRRSAQTSYNRRDEFSRNVTPARTSMDSVLGAGPAMDDSTWARSIQRQRIVEEIISSEESYIRDMKTLINVYLTVLPKNSQDRKTINSSVVQILQLHDELISELRKVMKTVQASLLEKASRPYRAISRHIRWRSLEGPCTSPPRSRTDRFARHSIDTSRPSLVHSKPIMADTKLVMDVAQVFDRLAQRFVAYETYAAYNDLLGECSTSLKMSSTWVDTEKGIEALSSLTIAASKRESDSHKALSFSDLVVKPIQRICKYPLFFSDLCKHTPACDDPVAHAQLQKVLRRLQNTAEEINFALSNPDVRKRIEISDVLLNRFEFDETPKTCNHDTFRKLGRVLLCGVLHVAFATDDRIKGQYMICVLYRSTMIFAIPSGGPTTYQVVISAPLHNANIEGADLGRGLSLSTSQLATY